MYWALPSEITDRAMGASKDEYKIPQPAQIIPPEMRRSALHIPRTSAVSGAKTDNWGLDGVDDNIW
jgi:hypothetical protein